MSKRSQVETRIRSNAALLKELRETIKATEVQAREAVGTRRFDEGAKLSAEMHRLETAFASTEIEARTLLGFLLDNHGEPIGDCEVPKKTTLAKARDEVSRLTAELREAKSIPSVPADVEDRLRAEAEAMVRRGQPTIKFGKNGELHMQWPDSFSGARPRDHAAFLLGPTTVFERLKAAVPSDGMTAEDKKALTDRLTDELDDAWRRLAELAWRDEDWATLCSLPHYVVLGESRVPSRGQLLAYEIDTKLASLLEGRSGNPDGSVKVSAEVE